MVVHVHQAVLLPRCVLLVLAVRGQGELPRKRVKTCYLSGIVCLRLVFVVLVVLLVL